MVAWHAGMGAWRAHACALAAAPCLPCTPPSSPLSDPPRLALPPTSSRWTASSMPPRSPPTRRACRWPRWRWRRRAWGWWRTRWAGGRGTALLSRAWTWSVWLAGRDCAAGAGTGPARRGIAHAWHGRQPRPAAHAPAAALPLFMVPWCIATAVQVIKNHFASEYIYHKYKDDKTCGVIEVRRGAWRLLPLNPHAWDSHCGRCRNPSRFATLHCRAAGQRCMA